MASDRSDKRSRRSDLLRLLAAFVPLALTGVLVYKAMQTQPVAANFTRVGGSTRVETSLEAARFWDTAPKSIVEIKASSPTRSIMAAAQCAMRLDAPLLFIRRGERRPVGAPIDSWRRSAAIEEIDLTDRDATCPSSLMEFRADGLSLLDLRDDPLKLPAVADTGRPARFAVFAAPKSRAESPDIAVGLALGAHLARDRDGVSLVIVPRYLPTSRETEERLRDHDDLVEGGVVLGERGILSDDSRTLLRQILVARDSHALVGELRTGWGVFQVFLLAILGLFGLRAAAPVAEALGRGITMRLHPDTPPRDGPTDSEGGTTMAQAAGSDSHGTDATNKEVWFVDLEGESVTIWLRSGGSVRGRVSSGSPAGAIRIAGARLARHGSEPDQPAETLLVPLENVLLVRHPPSEAPTTGIRRSSLRLVAEIVADITTESLIALEEESLVDGVEKARRGFKGAKHLLSSLDLDDLIDEAWTAPDVELHLVLRALKDGFQLMHRRSQDEVAQKTLFDALAQVAHVGARPVSWTALVPAHGGGGRHRFPRLSN